MLYEELPCLEEYDGVLYEELLDRVLDLDDKEDVTYDELLDQMLYPGWE